MIFFEDDDDAEPAPQRSLGRLLASHAGPFIALTGFTLAMLVAVGTVTASVFSDVPGLAWLAAILTRPLF
ncbi:hypothetical protein [Actinoplanes xinjiangensis]|uniref:hypothetical protein n=1 Tax=Actinoplanes xinjiangensis TaxID=512350 RepID=UPI00341D76FC